MSYNSLKYNIENYTDYMSFVNEDIYPNLDPDFFDYQDWRYQTFIQEALASGEETFDTQKWKEIFLENNRVWFSESPYKKSPLGVLSD